MKKVFFFGLFSVITCTSFSVVFAFSDKTVTRAEFIKNVMEEMLPGEFSGSNCFRDIKKQSFAKYICTAARMGIISSLPDGNFFPKRSVPFSEAAKIIITARRKPPPGSLEEIMKIMPQPGDPSFKRYVGELGLLFAIPVSIDRFSKNITRAEMVEILDRLKKNDDTRESLTYDSLQTIDRIMTGKGRKKEKEKKKQEYIKTLTLRKQSLNIIVTRPPPPPYIEEKPFDYSKLSPPPLPEIPKKFRVFPDDFDEQGQPTSGIYTYEDSVKGFFDDDLRASKILSGEQTYDMNTYDVCERSGKEVLVSSVTDDYGQKILSALSMLGYIQGTLCSTPTYKILKQFQRNHGLPESDIVDKKTLSRIVSELRDIQQRDFDAAKNFICTQYIVDAPQKGSSKNHLAFLYTLTLSAFPEKFQLEKTRNGCYNQQSFASSIRAKNKRALCDSSYWPLFFDEHCELQKRYTAMIPSEYQLVSAMLHEHAHTIDGYTGPWGTFDAEPFYAISYDIATKKGSEIGGYGLYMKPKFDWKNSEHQRTHLCSSYGLGWESASVQNYFTPFEDFAECVRSYVLQGIPFRETAERRPILKQKYEWLKKNLFLGREFNTGDPNYLSYAKDLFDFYPDNPSDHQPGYVWDYDFHALRNSDY